MHKTVKSQYEVVNLGKTTNIPFNKINILIRSNIKWSLKVNRYSTNYC